MEFTEQQYRSLAEQNQWFRRLLTRCLPIVQADAEIMAALAAFTAFAPEHRKHDTTEQDSARLVCEIPEALNSPPPAATEQPTRSAPPAPLPINLAAKDSRIYNACDRAGYRRGEPGKGQQAPARIYSVYAVDVVNGVETARTQSWDIWGTLYEESYPLHTLEPFEPKKAWNLYLKSRSQD